MEAFNVEEDVYLLFKITRVADLMRNQYYIDYYDSLFDNVKKYGYNKYLTLWGLFVVFFSKHPRLGKFQNVLKFHPSLLFNK